MNLKSGFVLIIIFCYTILWSQSSRLNYNSDLELYLDKLEVHYQVKSPVHSAIKPCRRSDFSKMLSAKTRRPKSHIDSLLNDNYLLYQSSDTLIQKGWFNSFFKNPQHFFQLKKKDFELVIDPLFNFQFGHDFNEEEEIFLNKRGFEIYGGLDQKFYFYSSFHENQASFKSYIEQYIERYQAIRGQGNYKDYSSSIFEKLNGYDFSNAQGYLGYLLSTNTSLELGHSKHHIGNGIRSLLLSSSGHNYFYIKFDARIWKIHYQSIFAELSTISARYNFSNQLLPKKYMASHYFSFKQGNFELGLFEAVIFSRQDHFEFQYLNPVILYRTIEHQLDSPDNVLIGLNSKWNIKPSFSAYGQFILDDINLKEAQAGDGWWGNKFGYQLGLKYYDVLAIPNLNLQIEWNQVRPFTYSHWQTDSEFKEISIANYSHYNQPLAHPLGANFSELLISSSWRPHHKFRLLARALFTKVGLNTEVNYGSDLLIPNFTREGDYGHDQNQGNLNKITNLSIICSYELFTRLFIDVELQSRKVKTNITGQNNQLKFFNLGFRYNVSNEIIDY